MAYTPVRTHLWTPPRGAVTITPASEGRHQVTCACCGWAYVASAKSDAGDQKRWHRCPAQTPGALPPCPTCSSEALRCTDDDGQPLPVIHPARAQLRDSAER